MFRQSHVAVQRFQLFAVLLSLTVAFCLLPGTVRSEDAAQDPVAADAHQEQVELWISQLDDDRFDTRQRAQSLLEQARPAPLEAVVNAAQRGSLESTTRALNILLDWSESKDKSLRQETLERLANLKHRPREAAMASRLLAEERERVALQELVRLGAHISEGIANRDITLDKRWKGTDDDLVHLGNVQRVTILRIYGTTVSDSGLKHLAQLREIRQLELFGTQATPAGIEKLKSQLPPGSVRLNSGALLGVRGSQDGTATITEVVPGSAADKAGILANDHVTELNGKPVSDFNELVTRIGEHKAGETAAIKLVRNGNPLTVKVNFDRWGDKPNPFIPQLNRNTIQVRGMMPRNQFSPPEIKVERR